MEVKQIPIDQIKPYERNAKRHPEEQVQQIANSLKEFGWQQPIVLDENNVIIIGHGRFLAAQKLGMQVVPAVYAEGLSKKQIKALRLADNKVNESGWDFNLLDEELQDLLDFDMSEFGFEIHGDIDLDGFFEDAPQQQKEPKKIQCPHCGEWFEG